MKKYILLLLTYLFFTSCQQIDDSILDDVNPINPKLNNSIPLGLSTFAIAASEFPLSDLTKSNSKIKYIAINELYTFPEQGNHSVVKDHLTAKINEDYQIYFELHILNEPAIRKSQDYFVNGLMGRKISNKDFENLILKDVKLQNGIKKLFDEAVSYAKEIEKLGVKVVISPLLEGTMSVDCQLKLISYLTAQGWSKKAIVLSNKYLARQQGTLFEAHPTNLQEAKNFVAEMSPGDIINTDGTSFTFDVDQNNKDYLFTQDEISQLINITQNYKIVFFLWQDRLQGLIQTGSNASASLDGVYNDRNYKIIYPEIIANLFAGIDFTSDIPLEQNNKIDFLLWKPISTGGGPGYEGNITVLTKGRDDIKCYINGSNSNITQIIPPSGYNTRFATRINCRQLHSNTTVTFKDKNNITVKSYNIQNPCNRYEIK